MTDRELLELLVEKVTNLEENQEETNQRLSFLEEGQKKLEKGQEKLEEGQKEIKTIVEAIDDRLDEMDGKNGSRHSAINLKLDVLIEDNKSIHEILGEHEVSIRTLRRRPV